MPVALSALLWMMQGRLWPLAAAASAAWGLICIEAFSADPSVLCVSASVPAGIDALVFALTQSVGLSNLTIVAAMIPAMMLPLLSAQIMLVCGSSLADRRGPSLALFFLGYLTIVAPGLLLLMAIAMVARFAAPVNIVAATTLIVSCSWQFTPAKRYALLLCHRRPVLALFGYRAGWTRLRFGMVTGSACLLSCWPSMLFTFASGALHVPAMAATFALLLAERTKGGSPLGTEWIGAGPSGARI